MKFQIIQNLQNQICFINVHLLTNKAYAIVIYKINQSKDFLKLLGQNYPKNINIKQLIQL